jgi:hypothetical protein
MSTTLKTFDSEHVHEFWHKSLERVANDPEGAITAARSLLETICKHILDDHGIDYPEDIDLPKLWTSVGEQLNLAPSQHQEKIFKAILGNCQAVVNNLAAIRNRVSDAHGRGRSHFKPKPRHATLVVNLAGAMAAFLVATLQEHRRKGN